MVKFKIIFWLISIVPLGCPGQLPASNVYNPAEIDFISDTQQPMRVEEILLRPTNNQQATSMLFTEILKTRPQSLYMLGDIISLGYKNSKWKKVDVFLDSCRKENIAVHGLLGNHDVIFKTKKGESNFEKRFPDHIATGYTSITDSVAVVLLNSNFKKLSVNDELKQNAWYQAELNRLDSNAAVKVIIVACHHAPYTNSKTVGPSIPVQQNFVPPFIKSKKARLFITGHAHDFEHFKENGKDFLVIGGGGGLHQPLNDGSDKLPDMAPDYKPLFHYLSVERKGDELQATSHFLFSDFTGFGIGHSFITSSRH